jgi:ketosteroid isomerase-like protein
MSQENVEIAKRMIDAYNRCDLDVLRAIFDPDTELDWSASRGIEAGVYRGIDATLRWLTGYLNTFEEMIVEPDCFIDAGESVVVPNVARVQGRDGIEVSARGTFVYTVRGRRITRLCLYQETEEALKAVGLAE